MKTIIIKNNITEYLRLKNDGWKAVAVALSAYKIVEHFSVLVTCKLRAIGFIHPTFKGFFKN